MIAPDAFVETLAMQGNIFDYRFNDDNFLDSSENKVPADNTMVGFAEGRYGRGAEFLPEMKARLNLGYIDIFSPTDFSFEAWLHETRRNGGDSLIFGDGSATGPEFSVLLGRTGALGLKVRFSDNCKTSKQRQDSVSGELNTWNHVAVTRSGDKLTMYLNGNKTTVHTIDSAFCSMPNDFLIGGRKGSAFFIGTMDEIKFSDYVKSEEQIQQSMCFDSSSGLPDNSCLAAF